MSNTAIFAIDQNSDLDKYLVHSIKREQMSRKLWLYFSLTVMATVAAFIAAQ